MLNQNFEKKRDFNFGQPEIADKGAYKYPPPRGTRATAIHETIENIIYK